MTEGDCDAIICDAKGWSRSNHLENRGRQTERVKLRELEGDLKKVREKESEKVNDQ